MLYAQAANSGIQALNVMGGGDNAGTIAAYNSTYANEQARYRAADQKNTAEQNISAINQDKILTNLKIEMNQQHAEAQLAVNAAVAGVSGSSVDLAIYGTEANASMRRQQAEAEADQLTEQQLANVSNAQADLTSALANAPKQTTVMDGLAQTASTMTQDDWKTAEAFMSSDDGVSSLWSD